MPRIEMTKRVLLRVLIATAVAIVALFPLLLSLMHQNGSNAYGSKNFAQSRHWLLVPAHFGNNSSQALLGAMYAMGQGVPQDGLAAVYWLERAAEAGVTPAQTMLGTLYATGAGIPRDSERAVLWLSKGAQGGDQEATRMLRTYVRPSAAM